MRVLKYLGVVLGGGALLALAFYLSLRLFLGLR